MFSFFAIILATALYGTLHSIAASIQVKALAEQWLGLFARRFYRLFYNLTATLGLILLLGLAGWMPDQYLYSIPSPLRFVTLGLQALALLCAVLALLQTGLGALSGFEQMTSHDGRPLEHPLSLGGFYRWMRHPVYTFGLLFIWLLPFMTLNLLALDLGLSVYTLVGIYFEERKLLAEFGEAYAVYRRRTPVLIPMFWKGFKKDSR